MRFEEEYQAFMDAHLQARTGERLRRLQEGHNEAEIMFLKQVWWPLFHHFQYLHPEYEVNDFKDGTRYPPLIFLKTSSFLQPTEKSPLILQVTTQGQPVERRVVIFQKENNSIQW